jgi:hypothetical protein
MLAELLGPVGEGRTRAVLLFLNTIIMRREISARLTIFQD